MARSRMLTALVLAAVLGLAGCGDDGEPTTTTSDPGVTTTTTPATTTTEAPTTTTTAGATTSSVDATTTTSPAGAAPGPVTVISAGPSAGSGEIQLDWEAVEGATDYRVERALAEAGPFELAGEIDAATGDASMADGVVNLWSPPADPGEPQVFQLIELLTDGSDRRYYRVVASNGDGDAAPSIVVCGAPTGSPGC